MTDAQETNARQARATETDAREIGLRMQTLMIARAADHFGVMPQALTEGRPVSALGAHAVKAARSARRAVMLALRRGPGLNAPEIADLFGCSVSGVAEALRDAEAQRAEEPGFAQLLAELMALAAKIAPGPLYAEAAEPAALRRMALSVEEAAETLGAPRAALKRAMAAGDLPSFLIGKRRRIRTEALLDWVGRLETETRAAA